MRTRFTIIAICIYFPFTIFSQSDLSIVWDLLLNNKRKEAKILFDKKLKDKKLSDIDVFTTDLILQYENGRLFFDKNEVKSFIQFEKSPIYIFPLKYHPLFNVFGESLYSTSALETVDIISSDPKFKNDEIFKISKRSANQYRRLNTDTIDSKINSINNWQVCGVFEDLNNSGIYTTYEPEKYSKSDKLFDARSNGKVGWYTVPNRNKEKGYYYFNNETSLSQGIVYAQIFIESPTDKLVNLNFGYQNSLKLFLNDSEIYLDDEAQPNFPNSNILRLQLKKGYNRLLLKYTVKHGLDNYFYCNFTNVDDTKVDGLVYHDSHKDYEKTKVEVSKIDPEYYRFFKTTPKNSSNFLLHQYLLAISYQQNGKMRELWKQISYFDTIYPNSSMIAMLKKDYFNSTDQDERVEELQKKMETEDSFYFANFIQDFQSIDFYLDLTKEEIEKKAKRSLKVDSIYPPLYKLLASIEENDKSSITKNAEDLLRRADFGHSTILSIAEFYKTIDNQEDKYLGILYDLYSKYENSSALHQIIEELEDAKLYDSIKHIHYSQMRKMPYDNYTIQNLIDFLIDKNAYQEALSLTDSISANFPYSLSAMETKGDIYKQLKKKDSAIFWYRKAMLSNPNDYSLHEKYHDFIGYKSELEKLRTQDIYQFISASRGKNTQSNKGVRILLDEYIENVFDSYITESKSFMIYEITGKEGIEKLKEINANGGHDYVRSEIIKPSGKIIPIENNGYTFVSTNLDIGDVILLDFKNYTNNTGRFYKDFNKWNYFKSEYPCNISRFGILYPDSVKFNFHEINGTSKMSLTKFNNKNFQKWEATNLDELDNPEVLCPSYFDRVHCIALSTIKNWGEIATWYYDLVRNNTKLEDEALDAYNSIFPNGADKYDEKTRAHKIYYYICDNLNYSYVNFRQSGFTPQKPSKTVRTRLGDCKDLSTLFVAMARKAGLDASTVLTLTSRNGTEYLKLPEIAFDHMIVKIKLNGKDNFLEMTDKDAGFLTYNLNIENALALVIYPDKEANEKSQLIRVKQNFENESVQVKYNYKINPKSTTLSLNITTTGNSGYYKKLFYSGLSEDLIKKTIEEAFSTAYNKPLKLIGYKKEHFDSINNKSVITINFETSEKPKSIGGMKLLETPIIYKPYSMALVSTEERKHNLVYSQFEVFSKYQSDVNIEIAPEEKFLELPKDSEHSFKEHSFKIKYTLEKPNQLNIKLEHNTSLQTITVAEYAEFKKYIENVLEKQANLISYK
ncbi:MAG: hypothetical protein JNL75_09550 [Chitinophagales bacterium]|nr:hypothetical protein [Chitinophagales bacterium]